MKDPYMFGKSKCATDLVKIIEAGQNEHHATVQSFLMREFTYLNNVYEQGYSINVAIETFKLYIKYRRLHHLHRVATGERLGDREGPLYWPETVYNHVNCLVISKARNYVRQLEELEVEYEA